MPTLLECVVLFFAVIGMVIGLLALACKAETEQNYRRECVQHGWKV